MEEYEFLVLESISKAEGLKRKFVLVKEEWNDWWEFETAYILYVVNNKSKNKKLGYVKIAEVGMEEKTPSLPKKFKNLPEEFYSLGQDDGYYVKISELPNELQQKVYSGLNDLAFSLDEIPKYSKEKAFSDSLMRGLKMKTVKGQFHRLATGGARLTDYSFVYTCPKSSSEAEQKLSFQVVAESNPPSNIHVIIGRNGVGKTYLLSNMIKSLIASGRTTKYGKFSENLFANIVAVSFSAFEKAFPISIVNKDYDGIGYTYVGLNRADKKDSDGVMRKQPPKSAIVLTNEFIKSAKLISKGAKSQRWLRALQILESDELFQQANIPRLISIKDVDEFEENAKKIFNNMSSGHKVVLLTITRLVESVDEKTFVILDEPEGHLHPPLLSSFIRALSDLLVHRNGVALIATHSPVVTQEVPKDCIWKIRRVGETTIYDRLNIESFGENISTLSSEVFGLELTNSGYHNILKEVVEKNSDYAEGMSALSNKVGSEGRAILRSLFLENRNRD